MKKLLYILVLLTGFAGFAAPPVINQPTNYEICQGFMADLTSKKAQILGLLNPNLYTVSFHHSQIDAIVDINPITVPQNYTPTNNEVIYVRVEDNANPADYSTTSFTMIIQLMTYSTVVTPDTIVCGTPTVMFQATNGTPPYIFTYRINSGAEINFTSAAEYETVTIPLSQSITSYNVDLIRVQSTSALNCYLVLDNSVHIEVMPLPTPLEPTYLVIDQASGLGNTASFDLTQNDSRLVNGQTGVTVNYFETQVAAETNDIAISAANSYTAPNGTKIWARVQGINGCAVIKSFYLYVIHPDDNFIFVPDVNFKAKLIALGTDTNTDGQIQESEAVAVTSLDISNSNISDLTGLEYFTAISSLVANNNVISNFEVETLTSLSSLSIQNNLLSSFTITAFPALTYLDCSGNQLTALNLSGISNFTNINCANNHISNLNISNMNCTIFRCSNNEITSLMINNSTFLQFFCDANNLQTLDLTTASISQLNCNNNQLSNLILNNTSVTFELQCVNNFLTALDLPNSQIHNIWCNNNLFITLDFSTWTNLQYLDCTNSPTLTAIYAKNGRNESISFDTNTNLEFICADESQLSVLQTMASGSSIIVTSYCTFTPGGNYNTTSGIVRTDINGNGCDNADVPMGFLPLAISLDSFPTDSSIYTNNSGNYTLYMSQPGTYTLNPILENPSYFNVSPVIIDSSVINNSTTVQNICITPNGVHSDVEVVIAPIARARPGFDATYSLVIKNKGNRTTSGNVTFSYDDAVLDFVSSDVLPNSQSAGLISFHFSELLPFENRSFFITLNVNSPSEIPAVNIEDLLNFSAEVAIPTGDDYPSDNIFNLKQIVVGSFDPNDITCLEGNLVAPEEIGNYLHYIINFENTGTAEAENIVVREVIDATQFDVSSLQVLNSSASLRTKVTGNLAEFIFQNINLHSGGHGNILIKIKTKNTLVEGDMVSKEANIYFDYNLPVQTLPEETYFQTLGVPGVEPDKSISVYPNPTKGIINISCSNSIKSVQLFDIQGRLLQTNLVNENQTTLNISNNSNGIYFIKVISDKGIAVQKIVKE